MKPLTIRNAAAIAGAAKASPKSLRNRAPTMTAGMVARTTKKSGRLAGGADRKKLGHAAQHGHDNCLQRSHDGPRRSVEMTPGGRVCKIARQHLRVSRWRGRTCARRRPYL